MQASKILFSEDELRRAENSEWILTKNNIIKKLMSSFGALSEVYREELMKYHDSLPAEIFDFSPKISKGEQHQGLPYIMLDYPRMFTRDDVFAIRTFFWWGNYFSLTLHLKGRFLDQFQSRIEEHVHLLAENHFYISHSDDEWAHEVHEATYTKLERGGRQLIANSRSQNNFLKLVCKWPVGSANGIHELICEQYVNLLKIIAG